LPSTRIASVAHVELGQSFLNASPRFFFLLGLLSCALAAPNAWAAADADAIEIGRRLDRCLSALNAGAETVPPYRRLILDEVCPGLARAVAALPSAVSLSQPLDLQTTLTSFAICARCWALTKPARQRRAFQFCGAAGTAGAHAASRTRTAGFLVATIQGLAGAETGRRRRIGLPLADRISAVA
jgi:hypothetical protein